jgi:hypothetical protein
MVAPSRGLDAVERLAPRDSGRDEQLGRQAGGQAGGRAAGRQAAGSQAGRPVGLRSGPGQSPAGLAPLSADGSCSSPSPTRSAHCTGHSQLDRGHGPTDPGRAEGARGMSRRCGLSHTRDSGASVGQWLGSLGCCVTRTRVSDSDEWLGRDAGMFRVCGARVALVLGVRADGDGGCQGRLACWVECCCCCCDGMLMVWAGAGRGSGPRAAGHRSGRPALGEHMRRDPNRRGSRDRRRTRRAAALPPGAAAAAREAERGGTPPRWQRCSASRAVRGGMPGPESDDILGERRRVHTRKAAQWRTLALQVVRSRTGFGRGARSSLSVSPRKPACGQIAVGISTSPASGALETPVPGSRECPREGGALQLGGSCLLCRNFPLPV